MARLLGVDPAANGTGWCLMEAGPHGRQIVECGCAVPAPGTWGLWDKAIETAEDIFLMNTPDQVVCEVPMYYGQNSKADANQLFPMAFIAGWMCRLGHKSPTLVRPRDWKGQVPKAIHNKRVLARLTAEERSMIDKCTTPALQNNVIDAAGLCLWWLDNNNVSILL